MKKAIHPQDCIRRVLSALLTIALLCSLSPSKNFLPVAAAIQPEYSGELLTYEFKLSAYYPPNTKYTDTNDTWKYAGNTAGWTPLSGATGSRRTTSASYVQLRYDNETIGTWFAFELNITTPGRYHVNLIHMSRNVGAIAEMFFMPATTEVEAGLISENSIGEVNYFAYPATDNNNAVLADVTATTAGKYLIVFRLKTFGAYGTGDYIYPSVLTLNGIVMDSATVALDKSEIEIGGTAQATASAKMNNGNDATDLQISYASSDTNIATVDPASGVITSVAAGKAKITATVTLDGITINDSAVVTVGHSAAATSGLLCITASNSGGGALSDVTIEKDAATPEFTLSNPSNYDIGTTFTITAPASSTSGKKFQYWKNVSSKRVVTTSNTCTFRIGSNTYLTAVYKDTESGVLVEFVDRNSKVLQSTYLGGDTTSITAPAPYSVGYDFQNWKSGDLTVNAGDMVTSTTVGATDTSFAAQYTKSATQYSVTVTGSEADGTSTHYYDDKISVTAAPPVGKKFAYWMRNGQITSYSASYNFYVWSETTVTAVFVPEDETLLPVPQIMMDQVKTGTGRVIFAAEHTVPDGYTLVETGILITDNSANATSTAFNLQNGDVYKAIAQSAQKNGQFTIRRDNISGKWYARAYLIYEDTETQQFKVVYSSNIVDGTAQ